MTIGDRIKARRDELGMSQEELAHKIGYKSKTSINKIELGIQELRQSKIKQIADALQTTPAYIMGWKETEEDQQLKKCHDLIEKCYGSDMYELVELYAKLNESGKNKIMGELRDTVALSKIHRYGKKGKSKNGIIFHQYGNIIAVGFQKK